MTKSSEPEPVDAEFEPAPVEDNDRPRRGGFGGGLLLFLTAAIAGGALGLAGAWWLDGQQAIPEATDPSGTLAALETRLAALESADPAGDIANDYAALRDRVERLESAPPVVIGEGDPETISALETRIAALEAAGSGDAGPAYDDSALTERLDTVAQTAERAETLANQALDGVSALPEGGGDSSEAITALEARIAALESAEPDESPAVDLSGLEARIAAAETLAQVASDRAASLEATRESGGDNDNARTLAARTLALMALAEIAETSDPFEAERAALARLWRGRTELSSLQSLARAGVPDRESLAADFPRAEIEAAAGPSRAFFGLIEVRRTTGAEDGDGPLALAALADARLQRGDLEGAVAATERLEGEALDAARPWLLSAQARLQVESALDSLRAALVEDAASQGEDPR
ncbi:hypothetical protein [Hyphobacterium marinum]|uniref:Inner membrane protein n=1 Tax=Hyphobacterium marinum TaxID=3116574 RepID=A0ABU7LUN2_9PROT|nr:hypothetical protein [Hyphobacterium sp. Y6023]MEE2565278.1 hypothetical protein [Hyphobacterium sp. Y6023]